MVHITFPYLFTLVDIKDKQGFSMSLMLLSSFEMAFGALQDLYSSKNKEKIFYLCLDLFNTILSMSSILLVRSELKGLYMLPASALSEKTLLKCQSKFY